MLKKTLFFAVFCCLLFTQFCFAQEIPTQATQQSKILRVAILPVISTEHNYPQVNEILSKSLKNEMHMPLNDVLQNVEYIDEESIATALRQSNFTYNQNLDTLKDTATILDADVVVGYSIPLMYQRYYRSLSQLDSDPLLNSFLSVKLWVYSRPLNQVFSLSDKRVYFDEISSSGMLSSLANDASYRLIKKAELKTLLKQSIKIKKGDS